MTDIALVFDPEDFSFDLALDADGDLLTDEGLHTAAAISLFTDARCAAEDPIPDGTTNQRGWWADRVDPPMRPNAPQGANNPDRTGSLLWLLAREKQVQSVLNRAQGYGTAAFAWMVGDGIAGSITVAATIIRTGVLGLDLVARPPSGAPVSFRFQSLWQAS